MPHLHGGYTAPQFDGHPDAWFTRGIDFQGFKGIIDSLGGINVNVGSYLSDNCDLPQAVDRYCTVYPGVMNMDGGTALWYVRSRHTSSDIDRNRRQQDKPGPDDTHAVAEEPEQQGREEAAQAARTALETRPNDADLIALLAKTQRAQAEYAQLLSEMRERSPEYAARSVPARTACHLPPPRPRAVRCQRTCCGPSS